jgi:hypothetical protein
MLNEKEALEMILKGMEPTLRALGLQVNQQGGQAALSGEEIALRIRLEDDRAALELRQPNGLEHTRLSLSLLELAGANEKDCRYIADEFSETLQKQFKLQRPGAAAPAKKPPKSVSKTAIRNGEAYYDGLSFANSFTGIYTQLRGAFKENYERYGEFLAEEFFLRQGGNEAVLKTLRSGDKTQMKRLFALLNEVYENGVNEAQSLVAVTILGAMDNDERLLASCVDYMSKDLAPVVIRVNAYLASGAGKKAKARLETPPLYKPKKAKKQGLLQQLMAGQPGLGG